MADDANAPRSLFARVILVVAALVSLAWPYTHGYATIFVPLAALLALSAGRNGRVADVAALLTTIIGSLGGALQVGWGGSGHDRWLGASLLVAAAAAGVLTFSRRLGRSMRRALVAAAASVGVVALAAFLLPSSANDGARCGSPASPKTFITVPGNRPATPTQIAIYLRASECKDSLADRRGLAASAAIVAAFWAVAASLSSVSRVRRRDA